MRATTTTLALALIAVAPAPASAQTYRFDVPEKLVGISFESNMEVEDILGTTRSLAGYVKKTAAGYAYELKVPVASLRTGIALRDEHLRSPMWLDAKAHPDLAFKGTTATALGRDRWKVSGTFTMKGVTRPLAVEVEVRQIPAATAARLGLEKVNWIRVRGTFVVKLSDFGVKIPAMAVTKVADQWTVKLSLFAKEAP